MTELGKMVAFYKIRGKVSLRWVRCRERERERRCLHEDYYFWIETGLCVAQQANKSRREIIKETVSLDQSPTV